MIYVHHTEKNNQEVSLRMHVQMQKSGKKLVFITNTDDSVYDIMPVYFHRIKKKKEKKIANIDIIANEVSLDNSKTDCTALSEDSNITLPDIIEDKDSI